MFKTNFRRIAQRLVILSVLAACLGAAATTPDAQAAAACPFDQWYQCEVVNGGFFNDFHCTCSMPDDIYACEQANGTWNYHLARCEF